MICLSLVWNVHMCNVPQCSESYFTIQLLAPFPRQTLELHFCCSLFWLDNHSSLYGTILNHFVMILSMERICNALSMEMGEISPSVQFLIHNSRWSLPNCFLHRSPAVAGAVVAMDRHYFQNTGAYDSDMTMWGAENLELSIRVKILIKTSSCDNYCNFKEPEWKSKKIFVKTVQNMSGYGDDNLPCRNLSPHSTAWQDYTGTYSCCELGALCQEKEVLLAITICLRPESLLLAPSESCLFYSGTLTCTKGRVALFLCQPIVLLANCLY